MHIPEKEKRNSIEALCGSIGAACKEIGMADVNRTVLELISGRTAGQTAGQTIGQIGGPDAGKTAPPLYFLPELLLFQGFGDKELDQFLDAYRAAGISKVNLKAAVTPWNIRWTIYELAEHLKEEHDSMS